MDENLEVGFTNGALEKAWRDLAELEPGSAEYERQAKAIESLEKAIAERESSSGDIKRAEAELKKADAISEQNHISKKEAFWKAFGTVSTTITTIAMGIVYTFLWYNGSKNKESYDRETAVLGADQVREGRNGLGQTVRKGVK